MGDTFEITLTGMKELIDNLDQIQRSMETTLFRGALRDACKQLASATAAESPEGLTGQLKKKPVVRAFKKRKKGRIGFSARYNRTPDGKFYANAINFGAKNSGRSKATIPKNDFMNRAFNTTAPQLAAELPQMLATQLEKQIEKLHKGPK